MIIKRDGGLGEEVLRDHQDLETLLLSMVRYVRIASGPSPEVVQRLSGDLLQLRELLERHFEREEDGGLFDDLQARLPAKDIVLDALKGEHGDFLDDVDELLGRLEAVSFESFGPIRQDLGRFLDTYQEHERVENELLQKAYNLDLGAPD